MIHESIAMKVAILAFMLYVLLYSLMLTRGPRPLFFGTMLWVHSWGSPKWMAWELFLRVVGTFAVKGIWYWIYLPNLGFIRTIVEGNTETGEIKTYDLGQELT